MIWNEIFAIGDFFYEQRWGRRFADMDDGENEFYGVDVVDAGFYKYHHSQ